MQETDPVFLFTYGTLMSGCENPLTDQLQSLTKYEGDGYMHGLLYLVSWYPGAIYHPDSDAIVVGEVLKIEKPELLLPLLDDYEDVFEDEDASLYLRKVVPVKMKNGSMLYCWAYLYNQPVEGLQLIPDGNFRSV